jgi:Uncharacterized protein conserved in bacteria
MMRTEIHRRPARDVEPGEALRTRIRESVSVTKSSSIGTRTRLAAAFAVIPLLAALVVWSVSEWVYGRPAAGLDVGAQSAMRLLWALAPLVAMTVASTLIAAWRGQRGFGASALCLALALALVAPLYAAFTVPDPVHVDDPVVAGVVISPWGLRCVTIAGVVGVTVLVGLTMALRRAVPVASRLRGGALGAAAGAWAGLAVFLFCPSGDQLHLLVGHVLPVAVLTLAGALATPSALRP